MKRPRYLLEVTDDDATLRVRVLDGAANMALACWDGRIVRELVASNALPPHLARIGVHACDKTRVWHLILAATAAQMALTALERAGATVH